MKEPFRGRKFPTSDHLEREVSATLRAESSKTGKLPISKSYQRWQRYIDLGVEYVESATA
jgi:hypothetical protein